MTQENKKADKLKKMREKLIMKLIPTLRNGGFQTLTMEEIAKIMSVSRATLYKHFSNKENIFHVMTEEVVQYIKEMTPDLPQQETLYVTKFHQVFEQSVSLATFITDDFLNELQNSYPFMYDKLWEAIQFREKQLLVFYRAGMQNDVFNQVNEKLLILQDKMLFYLLDVKYLMKNQLTIQQALFDFYELRKIQLFKPEMISTVDDSSIVPRIEYLTQKISNMIL